MSKKVNRRRFLGTAAAGIGAASVQMSFSQNSLPRRVLGKTGVEVSILAFGGGSRFLMYEDEDEALDILNEAIDSGISYLDTAVSYGNGESELRYGKVLKDRRKEVFLATKTPHRGYDDVMREMEKSLQRLQTDHVDLLHVHSLEKEDDLAKIEAPEGALRALYRIREEGMTRFIGMTSHTDAPTLKTAVERHDLDCVQMALNAATKTGYSTGFEEITLPVAQAKNLGILAMKITGQESLVGPGKGQTVMRELLYYSMSLPVASCVVGMPRPDHLRENIALAKAFSPLAETEKSRIRSRVQPSVAAFHSFLIQHSDRNEA